MWGCMHRFQCIPKQLANITVLFSSFFREESQYHSHMPLVQCKLGSREMPNFSLLSSFKSFIVFVSGIALKAVDLLKMYYVKSQK